MSIRKWKLWSMLEPPPPPAENLTGRTAIEIARFHLPAPEADIIVQTVKTKGQLQTIIEGLNRAKVYELSNLVAEGAKDYAATFGGDAVCICLAQKIAPRDLWHPAFDSLLAILKVFPDLQHRFFDFGQSKATYCLAPTSQGHLEVNSTAIEGPRLKKTPTSQILCLTRTMSDRDFWLAFTEWRARIAVEEEEEDAVNWLLCTRRLRGEA